MTEKKKEKLIAEINKMFDDLREECRRNVLNIRRKKIKK